MSDHSVPDDVAAARVARYEREKAKAKAELQRVILTVKLPVEQAQLFQLYTEAQQLNEYLGRLDDGSILRQCIGSIIEAIVEADKQ